MSTPSEDKLQRATRAIQTGDRDTGRRLLVQVLRESPDNTQAWLLMSSVVEDGEWRRYCLRRLLAIDSDNATARAGLAWLDAHPEPDGGHSTPELPSALRALEGLPGPGVLGTPPAVASLDHGSDAAALGISDRAGAGAAGKGRAHDSTSALRHRGYRNTMLAGAMTLTLLCGLVMLVFAATRLVPQARLRRRPTSQPILFTATLWCPPCSQAGSPVVLWERAGDGVSRGAKVGELPHDSPVSILAREWSEAEQRTYFRVAGGGQAGWVPEQFIKPESAPSSPGS